MSTWEDLIRRQLRKTPAEKAADRAAAAWDLAFRLGARHRDDIARGAGRLLRWLTERIDPAPRETDKHTNAPRKRRSP